jgi:hypothetical protein
MVARPQKITFAEMRSSGVRGVLVYCSDYRCSHYIAVMANQWGDDVRLSDIERRFVCSVCGKRGADVRPDFSWNAKPVEGLSARPGHLRDLTPLDCARSIRASGHTCRVNRPDT